MINMGAINILRSMINLPRLKLNDNVNVGRAVPYPGAGWGLATYDTRHDRLRYGPRWAWKSGSATHAIEQHARAGPHGDRR